MYVYYEKFPAAGNIPVIYQLVFSSNGVDTIINWKSDKEKMTMNLLTSVFKQVPLKEREFNDQSKIWSFFGYRGDVIIIGIQSMMTQGLLPGLILEEIVDLEERAKRSSLNRPLKQVEGRKKFKDEDFFYNNQPVTTTGPSGVELITKISILLEQPTDWIEKADDVLLKKAYRKAALKYHPDRNNGDGTKMTELNYLWNIFMSQSKGA